MEIVFYVCGLIAIVTSIRVVTHTNPVHALLYLIISLLAVAAVFFALGAYFAGALEIIVYAGAIMVLFVFVVMMLNLGQRVEAQEKAWLQPAGWIGPGVAALLLLVMMIYGISSLSVSPATVTVIDAKAVGIRLFGPYVLAVELASMMLLAGLVVAYHLGRERRSGDVLTHTSADHSPVRQERKETH